MGWLMLVSIPAGLIAFVGWLILFILHRASWQKRISAGVPPPIPPPTPPREMPRTASDG
jgi:hypothetical protein